MVTDDYVMVSLRGVPGNSGSALLDEAGNVVGILSMGQWGGDREHYILAVRTTKLQWE